MWFLSAILLHIPPILNLGRMVTADPLATDVVVLALFALTRNRELLAVLLLLTSIVVRSDNVVLVGILIDGMVWRRHYPPLPRCPVRGPCLGHSGCHQSHGRSVRMADHY